MDNRICIEYDSENIREQREESQYEEQIIKRLQNLGINKGWEGKYCVLEINEAPFKIYFKIKRRSKNYDGLFVKCWGSVHPLEYEFLEGELIPYNGIMFTGERLTVKVRYVRSSDILFAYLDNTHSATDIDEVTIQTIKLLDKKPKFYYLG